MKKNLLRFRKGLLFTAVVAGGMTTAYNLVGSSSAPPQGFSGGPGDTGNCTTCHAGSAITVNGGISTDIPSAGYTPGETYNITVGAGLSSPGSSKYGFSFTAQNASGTALGSLTGGGNVATGSNYVGHNGPLSASSPSWSFTWTAPSAGSGAVGFYTAVNATNGDGGTGGDVIVLSDTTIQENIASSVEAVEVKTGISAFASANTVSIVANGVAAGNQQLEIYNFNGQLVATQVVSVGSGTSTVVISCTLDAGAYVAKLGGHSAKFVK